MFPDASAAKVALEAVNKYLGLAVDLSWVEVSAAQTKKTMESFGLVRNISEEKKKEEEALRWYI
jgi:predicted ATP-grasp superfamily ATP-dependent carboligase